MSDHIKPCPFCGGEAEIINIDEGENYGGSCVCCTQCQASSNVEFERKENFVGNWNRRSMLVDAAMVEAAQTAYREGVYLTDEQVLASVTKIVCAALSAAQAQPVAIKPLEWEYVERRAMTYTAFWADGDVAYYINQSFGSDSYYFRTIRWPEETIYDGDDLPSAKAAAQSDYETRIRSALVSAPAVPGEVQVKHKKRGSVYDVIGVGRMQAESWIDEARPAPVDMREVTIYRSVDDGALWVRPREEFEDGRFEALSVPLPEVEGGDKGDAHAPEGSIDA